MYVSFFITFFIQKIKITPKTWEERKCMKMEFDYGWDIDS